MAKAKILQDKQAYTFRSYFELPYEPDEILAELGYELRREQLQLPQHQEPLPFLSGLRDRLNRVLPLVSLTSEIARREILVAPVLMEVVAYCNCPLRIEYPLYVSDRLKGNLDYLVRSSPNLLVIEAKNDDLTRGFTQLAAEMIALAEAEAQGVVYGAVTMGNAWNFGRLEQQNHQIVQDIALYAVPNELETLVRAIVGLLQP